MEEKVDEKSVKFSEEQAVQIICAALQSGAIKLPFGDEIRGTLLQQRKEIPSNISTEAIISNIVFTQIKDCAKADAEYLLSFYQRLIRGLLD